MNNNFEIFVNMDNEELYSKTYITYTNLDDIKNKNFSAFTRYKFNGFIDILTKRLNLDLEDLKNEANEYFDQYEPKVIIEIEEPEKDKLNLTVDRKIAISIGLIVVAVALLAAFFIAFNSTKQEEIYPPVEPVVEEQIVPIEQNITHDINTTDVNNTFVPKTQEVNTTAQTPQIPVVSETPKKTYQKHRTEKSKKNIDDQGLSQKNIWADVPDSSKKEPASSLPVTPSN